MRNLIILLLILGSCIAKAQIRAFDNSKSVMPWLYNPAASFSKDFQAYIAYDGRGNSSFMPQSIVAGLRMPVMHGKRYMHRNPTTMIGVQLLNTNQDMLKSSTINASFAHQIEMNKTTKLALGLGAGIFNMRYNYGDLVYLDQQDPLLGNGENFFNIHLNAGISFVLEDRFMATLAAPYLLKDGRANINEIILRLSYNFTVNPDFNLITSANLDTYNKNMIYGGDVRAEWRKIISVLAGADRYKYHAGLLLDIKPICIGYTYGQNFNPELGNVASHQITIFSHIPARNNNF